MNIKQGMRDFLTESRGAGVESCSPHEERLIRTGF